MFDKISRKIILSTADISTVRKLVTKFGMDSETGFARRFVAGETLDEAVAAVKVLNDKGINVSLDLLGESVSSVEETQQARDRIIEIVDRIHESGVNANVSVKLTQIGLDLGNDVCIDNVKMILLRARQFDNWVRVDMEGSDYTQQTLDVFQYLFERVSNNVGIVLQSYLYRTEFDVVAMNKLGARVRLCKGAYLEPETVAFRKKSLTDLNYIRCMKLLLNDGNYPAFATHDVNIIEQIKEYVESNGIDKNSFEFQMLYGIRTGLQEQLVKDGYNMRVYVPFGSQWYPYFSRRLGERFGNVMFILKSMFHD